MVGLYSVGSQIETKCCVYYHQFVFMLGLISCPNTQCTVFCINQFVSLFELIVFMEFNLEI